jgi:hypothetical protein
MTEQGKQFEKFLGNEYAKVVEKTQSLHLADRLDRTDVMLAGLVGAGMYNLGILGLNGYQIEEAATA